MNKTAVRFIGSLVNKLFELHRTQASGNYQYFIGKMFRGTSVINPLGNHANIRTWLKYVHENGSFMSLIAQCCEKICKPVCLHPYNIGTSCPMFTLSSP